MGSTKRTKVTTIMLLFGLITGYGGLIAFVKGSEIGAWVFATGSFLTLIGFRWLIKSTALDALKGSRVSIMRMGIVFVGSSLPLLLVTLIGYLLKSNTPGVFLIFGSIFLGIGLILIAVSVIRKRFSGKE